MLVCKIQQIKSVYLFHVFSVLIFRYECSNGGGTPQLKFNSTGSIKGVIGGSYSTVSIQVSRYTFVLINQYPRYIFLSLPFVGSQSFEAFSHSSNLACLHS